MTLICILATITLSLYNVDMTFAQINDTSLDNGQQLCQIYTQTKVKQHHIFFGDTVLENAERNMLVMEIKYFEFYCRFYYFYGQF